MSKQRIGRQDLVLLWFGIPPVSSKAIFQRPLALAAHYDIHLIALDAVCAGVLRNVRSVSIFPLRHHALSRLLFPLWGIWQAWRLLRRGSMDAIMTLYPPYMLIVGLFFRAVFRVHWIADLLDNPGLWLATHRNTKSLMHEVGRWYHGILLHILKRNLAKADLIISVGSAAYLIRNYHVSSQRIIEVTNGVNLDGIPNIIASENHHNKPILLYVGHIRKERGIGTILHALSLLRERNVLAIFRLVGPIEPHEEQWLFQEITRLDLSEFVELVGVVPHDKVWEEIAKATICLYPFPSRPELDHVSPIKVFEYMAMGKVTVASDLPGVRTLIQHKINGYLVSPEKPNEWAQVLMEVLLERDTQSVIGTQAAISVREFDWNKINDAIVERIGQVFTGNIS